jgi:hypothetical protein
MKCRISQLAVKAVLSLDFCNFTTESKILNALFHLPATHQEGCMRDDVLIDDVLAKCDVLKRAGFWPTEPKMRPRAWLNCFDKQDRAVAATLLDRFVYYNSRTTDALLIAAYRSIGDGMLKGPTAPTSHALAAALDTAVFTPVRGEHPNPTDSGNYLCRKARQLLGVPENRIVDAPQALDCAFSGVPVVFIDDFVGSGDQFLSTWTRQHGLKSFQKAYALSGFTAAYVVLVATRFGIDNIHRHAPSVGISPAHLLDDRSTLRGFWQGKPELQHSIESLLEKYVPRLTPAEDFIANDPKHLRFGYKDRGLMLAFEHSVPDSTLPIFWSSGVGEWRPLIERN